ncbi:hypothetical protein ES707_20662 [subsurface metagenome]
MDLNKVIGIVKVREGGKVTIPDAVVDELRLEPGDSIEIIKIPGKENFCLRRYGDQRSYVEGAVQVAVLPVETVFLD